jgi:flagellar biosynthesis protein FlhG
VGGGKGGVGKSLVATSLAVAFAARGRRSALVDLDLGAANLHTLLGLERPSLSLSDFFAGEVASLDRILCRTRVPGLSLVSGARGLFDMANPLHSRKQKLIRQLRALPAQEVVLDLGAGTAFNVLDFFVAADRGLLVVAPEPTSIENAYHFLKTAFFRSLREVARCEPVRSALEQALREGARGRAQSPRDLVSAAAALDREAGELLWRRVRAFAPLVLVNGARTPADRHLGAELARAGHTFLGSSLEFLGTLDHDECVPRAVREHRPVRELFPASSFARGIEALAQRLLALDEGPAAARLALASAPPASAEAGAAEASARPAPDLALPGEALRRRRRELGLSLAQAVAHTRIRCLEQIEEERFEQLPEEPYLRGFLLSYARDLGLPDPDALAARYLERRRSAQAGRPRA